MPRAREIVNIVQAIRGNLNQISIQNSPQCFIVIFHITIQLDLLNLLKLYITVIYMQNKVQRSRNKWFGDIPTVCD